MSVCPSCGREAGSSVTCPHCGANLKRRMSIAIFGVLAVVLAIGGLALLYTVSINTPIPTIQIAQIQASMNYAYVRVEGVVKRAPNYNPEAESLTFNVDDGTGSMLVSAFRSEAQGLLQADRVPAIGDRVSVEGTLRVREGVPSLTINSIEAVALTRLTDPAPARDIASIAPADALSAVTVRGQIRAVREPSAGFRLITLRDATGAIDVVIDRDVSAFGSPAPDAQAGDSIEVTGVVTLFEDNPQVTLTRGERMAILDQPIEITELMPIREIGDQEIGEWVRVQGTIARVAPFSAGVKFTLNDAQGRGITLLLWHDVFNAVIDAADWQIGADVTAQGAVNAFRGELEIVPELPLDVSILARAVADTPDALGLTPLGAITPADLGQTVFVSGTIESVDRFADGVRFRLEDDSGSILLVLFTSVFDQVEDGDRLQEGASVSALGKVSEFNGALEVIPPNGASVRVGSAAEVAQVTPTPEPLVVTPTPQATPAIDTPPTLTPAPPAGTIPIDAIDASLVGQTVSVRGQVIAASSFSAGFRFTLDDGTGTLQLVLFDGRYREVADRAALNLGAQISAQAVVVEFNGTLELQPASGADVSIERAGSSSIIKARAINTLSNSDIGTLAAVVGDVLRVEGFSSGVSVFVNDGTGELRVVIFNNVLNFVPNAPSLQAGVKVRVVGRIDEFNGALELVPALGYDVTINP